MRARATSLPCGDLLASLTLNIVDLCADGRRLTDENIKHSLICPSIAKTPNRDLIMNRTKRKILINMCGAVIGALWLLVAALQGQTRMPQDNWYFYKTFGGYGSGPGQLNSPYGLCVGPNDRICIADTYNNRIQIFDDEGNLQASFAVSDPRDVAAGRMGSMSREQPIGSGNWLSEISSRRSRHSLTHPKSRFVETDFSLCISIQTRPRVSFEPIRRME